MSKGENINAFLPYREERDISHNKTIFEQFEKQMYTSRSNFLNLHVYIYSLIRMSYIYLNPHES